MTGVHVVTVQMDVTYQAPRGVKTVKDTIILTDVSRTEARTKAKDWAKQHYGEGFRSAKVVATAMAELVDLVPFQYGFIFEGNEDKVIPAKVDPPAEPKRVVRPKRKKTSSKAVNSATVALRPKRRQPQQVQPRDDAHYYKVTLIYMPGPTKPHLKPREKVYQRVPATSARHAIEQALRKTHTPTGYNGAPKTKVARLHH